MCEYRLPRKTIEPHRAVSLLELLVVLAIIGTLVSLTIPALMMARESARSATCINNVHQIQIAIHSYQLAKRRLPDPPNPGLIGGWTVELLPYLELPSLYSIAIPGVALSNAPARLNQLPAVLRCPSRIAPRPGDGRVEFAHYGFTTDSRGDSARWFLADLPTGRHEPWLNCPEQGEVWLNAILVGPHMRGFHVAGYNSSGAERYGN